MPTVHVRAHAHVSRDATVFETIDATLKLVDDAARSNFPSATRVVVRPDLSEIHEENDEIIADMLDADPTQFVSHVLDDIIGADFTLTLDVDVDAQAVCDALNAESIKTSHPTYTDTLYFFTADQSYV